MFPYLLIFGLTTFLVFKSENKRSSKIQWLYGLLAVLIISTFAGSRALTIGTDTGSYPQWAFDTATRHFGDWNGYVTSMPSTEWTLLILGYAAVFFHGNIHFILFFYALFTALFFYLAIRQIGYKYHLPQWLAWLTYCCFFFNLSLNMMRQSAAIAVLLYALSLIPERQLTNGEKESLLYYSLRSTLLIFFAMLWHRTAVIGFVFLFIRLFIFHHPRSLSFWSLILILFPPLVPSFATLAAQWSLFPARYSQYLNGGYASSLDPGQLTLGYMLLLLIVVYIFMKEHTPSAFDPFFLTLFIGFISFNTFATQQVIYRLAFYFSSSLIYIIPACLLLFSRKDSSRRVASIALVILLLSYWYFVFVFAGYNDTIPYALAI